jgi:signal peptidase
MEVDDPPSLVRIPEAEDTSRSAVVWGPAPRHRSATRSALDIARRALDVALLIAALAALAAGVVVFAFHLQLRPVLSGSMRPGYQPGDLAVVRPVDVSALEVGDVVVYHPPGEGDEAVMHRIASLEREADGIWITTKGDANDAEDPWGRARLRGDTAYRVAAVVPKVGYLPVWGAGLRGPLLIGAGLLLALTVIAEARRKPGRTRAVEPAEGGSP